MRNFNIVYVSNEKTKSIIKKKQEGKRRSEKEARSEKAITKAILTQELLVYTAKKSLNEWPFHKRCASHIASETRTFVTKLVL